MINYLKTKEDKDAYVRILLRRTRADGVVSPRELAFIKAMLSEHEISDEIFYESSETFKRHSTDDMTFSCVEASIQAFIDALTLSAVDMDFSSAETKDSFDLAKDIDISYDDAVKKIIDDYIVSYTECLTKTEACFDKFYGKKYFELEKLLPTTDDKKSFVKVLLYMAVADSELSDDEIQLLNMLERAYPITHDQAWDALKEFKIDPHKKLEFSDEEWLKFSLRSALRIACADKEFSDAEKNSFKELCRHAGYSVVDSLLDELSEATKLRINVEKLKSAAFEALLSLNQ